MSYVTLEEYEKARKRFEAEFTKRLSAQGMVIVARDDLHHVVDITVASTYWGEAEGDYEAVDRLKSALAPPVEGD